MNDNTAVIKMFVYTHTQTHARARKHTHTHTRAHTYTHTYIVVLVHVMTTRGSGCRAPRILYLDIRWKWVVSFTSRLHYYRRGCGGGGCPITDVDSFEGRKYLHPVGGRKRFVGRDRSLDTIFDCAIFRSCMNSQISASFSWTFLPNGASSETWISEQNSKTLFSVT